MVGFIKKGMNLARAYTKWALAGRPLRDDEYIFHLYDNHCSQCPLFIQHTENTGECDACGCHIKRVSAVEDDFNKLAWPTEACPEGYWSSDIDEPEQAT
jgi:hypothetical protein